MKTGFETFVSRAKAPLSAALVLLLLVLQTLSAASALHQEFHSDATDHEHQCAVSLLSQGHLDISEPALTLPVAPAIAQQQPVISERLPLALFLSLPSSRGPPAAA